MANQGLNVIGQIAKEGSAIAKGVAVAQATMNTFQGVTAALSATSTIPEPMGGILKAANAVGVGVSGLLNVKKILATKPVSTTAPSGGATPPPAPQAPAFDLVNGSGSNQIAESVANAGKTPIKAYVVSGDMSTAQEQDRNVIEDSTI